MTTTPPERGAGAPALSPAGAPGWSLTLRAFRYWSFQYRRTWRGSVAVSVVSPILFLAAMGVGLGTVVDHGSGRTGLAGVPYLSFIAPGLLASTAMQSAATDASYPVIGAIKWQKQYLAMLATPLRVVDVLRGHVLWILVRTAGVAASYLAIMACFGVLHSARAALAWPAATLLGAAFATPLVAFSAGRERDTAFPVIQRLVIIPLFLFSGAFFPISQLPAGLQYVAKLTPLWHGTELCRSFTLGSATLWPTVAHVGYLLALAALGLLWASRVYERKLAR